MQHRRPSLWRLTAKWCPLVRSHHKQPAPDRVPCTADDSLIAVLPLFGRFMLTLKNCYGRTETSMWSFHPPVKMHLTASLHIVLNLEGVCYLSKGVSLMLQYGQRLRTNSSWFAQGSEIECDTTAAGRCQLHPVHHQELCKVLPGERHKGWRQLC